MNKEKIYQILNLFSEHNLNKLIIKEKDFEIEIEKENNRGVKELIENGAKIYRSIYPRKSYIQS